MSKKDSDFIRRFGELSNRERQVISLVTNSDLTYKEIAKKLGIAEGTFNKYLDRAKKGLDIKKVANVRVKVILNREYLDKLLEV